MRRNPILRLFAAFLLAALPAAARAQAPAASEPPREVRVLFIGNSLTYYHDLPRLFADFANATWPGRKVVTESVTAPGESLKGHWDAGRALEKIRGAHWDYVVLQEQGGVALGAFLLDGASRYGSPDEYWDYGGRFAAAATAAGARAVLYQTYETKASDRGLPYLDYACHTLGAKSGALVAPVARVWHRVKGHSDLELYDADGGHPSLLGSYLATATLAATMFGDLPDPGTAWHPDKIPAGAAKTIVAAVGAVRGELGKPGGAAVPAPKFAERPHLEGRGPLTVATLKGGSWTAVADGLDVSFGARLEVTFADGAPRVELVDYTLHGAFALPVEHLAADGGVLRFDTRSQNRIYRVEVAPRGEDLAAVVEWVRGKTSQFVQVTFRRDGDAKHFAFLDESYAAFARPATQEAFEAALVGHYDRLADKLGAERLGKILDGVKPLEEVWWSLLTGAQLRRLHRYDEAIRFETFATHRFPRSPFAFESLSEGLEEAGRFAEAHAAILQAEALAAQQAEPELRAYIAETKARIEKEAQPKAEAPGSR